LGDFLNSLLDGLYPLLPQVGCGRSPTEPQHDRPQQELMRGCYWSKALGLPVEICFGPTDAVAPPHSAFVRAERVVADALLGLTGVVTIPDAPPFAAFNAPRPG
jgi:hypothetical protein